jgi:8-oxo-dGTP pyrophosphatase MutT (NUDIX family)
MNELHATHNRFGGMYIHADGLPDGVETFAQMLTTALDDWKTEALNVAWLEIPADKSHLIPVAVTLGFQFHHCEGQRLILITRLRADAFIFPDASHYAAAGAVVLNAANDLLVVKERYRNPARPDWYKLPGGLLNEGEHIAAAAVREVHEETGIAAEFEALTCFRHIHGLNFGKSNFYFICRLKPLTFEITIDPGEIEEACWMPVQEFLTHAHVHAFNKQIVETSLTHATLRPVMLAGDHRHPSESEIYLPGE